MLYDFEYRVCSNHNRLVFEVNIQTYYFRLLPLWVGARGIEFDWKYMQMSLDSNICLVSLCKLLQLNLKKGRKY